MSEIGRKSRTLSAPLMCMVALLTLTSCQTNSPAGDTAIEAVCREWGRSLPSRSRSDTMQTQREIERAYNVHEAVCS